MSKERDNLLCQVGELMRQRDDGKIQRDELLAALKSAKGFLMNAAIDLETGAPKKTAIDTINGGLKIVSAAIAKAEGAS